MSIWRFWYLIAFISVLRFIILLKGVSKTFSNPTIVNILIKCLQF
jgi:hypothetical protein